MIKFLASQHDVSIESSDSEVPVKLTANLIQEGLQIANKLGQHFIKNYPNVERAAQFQHEPNSCMACYKELYKEVARIGEQRLITEFIVKNVEAEENVQFKIMRAMIVIVYAFEASELMMTAMKFIFLYL